MSNKTYRDFECFTLKIHENSALYDFQYLFFTKPTKSGYTVFDSNHLDRYNTT